LYFTGSTTKAFCAALLAHLINSKKYPELSKGWDTPISSILHDDFVLQDDWATKHLTLRDAAGHITGMSRHDLSLMRETNGKESTNRDFVRNLRHLPMPTEPRKQFQYCNYMYFVLSHVIETVTGQWLGDCLREHIFQPLGMNATFLDMKDAENAPEHVADSYLWSEDDKKYNKLPHMPARQLSGAGGLISTVKDYAKWAKALIYKSDVFNEATHADIRSSISIATASDELDILYGLGWMRRVVYDKVAYIHNGSTGTFGSYVIWFPHVKFGVVAFSNGFETAVPVTNVLAWRLIADRLEVSAADRVDVNDK
jgi:CubicO group peptidase (beta-lactamase class C family)